MAELRGSAGTLEDAFVDALGVARASESLSWL
jgi:hypothetical protein